MSLVSNFSTASLDMSACDAVLHSDGGGGIEGACYGESPVGVGGLLSPTLSPPHLALMVASSSTPNSPQVARSAATGWKLGGVFMCVCTCAFVCVWVYVRGVQYSLPTALTLSLL